MHVAIGIRVINPINAYLIKDLKLMQYDFQKTFKRLIKENQRMQEDFNNLKKIIQEEKLHASMLHWPCREIHCEYKKGSSFGDEVGNTQTDGWHCSK